MLDDHDMQVHRKARLRELIDNAAGGLISQMADRIGRSESYLGRMLYPPEKPQSRPVSDKFALLIEREFTLARGWFDLPLGAALPYPMPSSTRYAHGSVKPEIASEHLPRAVDATTGAWPFHLANYQRIQALTTGLGRRGNDALRDIDAHLDIVITKWERELERTRRANSGKEPPR